MIPVRAEMLRDFFKPLISINNSPAELHRQRSPGKHKSRYSQISILHSYHSYGVKVFLTKTTTTPAYGCKQPPRKTCTFPLC